MPDSDDRAIEVMAKPEWRPMTLAPKDGTDVILGFGFGVVQSAVWNASYGGWVLIGDDHPQISAPEPLGWIPMPV